jgi:hypothetical protein
MIDPLIIIFYHLKSHKPVQALSSKLFADNVFVEVSKYAEVLWYIVFYYLFGAENEHDCLSFQELSHYHF